MILLFDHFKAQLALLLEETLEGQLIALRYNNQHLQAELNFLEQIGELFAD